MKKKYYVSTGLLFLMFLSFTVIVLNFDVKEIGPNHSFVGLATLNQFMFDKLGVNLLWYAVTDWLGIVAVLIALCFCYSWAFTMD